MQVLCLARLPIGSDPHFDKDESIVEIYSEVNMLDSHVILNLPLSAKTVADYTRKDSILANVAENQDKNKVRTYLNAHTEITSKDGVLLRDSRLCARVLNMLHLTHIGIDRMKSLARMHVWWQHIELDIAAHCKDCTAWPKPAQIYLKICLNGPFQMAHGSAFTLSSPDRSYYDTWLFVMDAYSKCPNVL